MFDEKVVQCFLDNQLQLYLEKVAQTPEEAGIDLEGVDEQGILEADEVFEIGDGRYLIVEG